ncbi:30S ribosomal protein S1 [Candidatus Falkowbacteria bacterium HGW-Falkowbacteria-2]|uniref:30S ribosomal protein S1 n=1 Tax=Candidatus Falkowbacteria bacterium HGW-Falkowbacteria-2 TaxID=2013769 RepID=A0A2N2E047_9BACT|nr:MAG: 30S ribosomal protein S1 [Candidatus Falkowbacteria bacterium HGW-Falkowbacteria-2]
MSKDQSQSSVFADLLEKDGVNVPQVGDIIKGTIITASKSEVILDIDGVLMGVVRGPELYVEVDEYAHLKPGDQVEAAVIEAENESGRLELSFRQVGQEKAWNQLRESFKERTTVKIRIIDANKGGLLARYCQINGFLPVSQLAPENYPRISGGDKSKILEKLKTFVGQEFEVNVITLNEDENKIIFSEKDVWNKKQKPALDRYSVGMVVDGRVTAITSFGVFLNFDDGMEGLIHISEIAWQRIDSPSELFKVGDHIKAEIVSIDGSKIFLSSKKLQKDPWQAASAKYSIGQTVSGLIVKINPFGLFVKLDEEIHGLAHISQLSIAAKDKIGEMFAAGETRDFEIVSISPSEHRLGLKLADEGGEKAAPKKRASKAKAEKEEETEEKEEKTEKETKKAKAKEEKTEEVKEEDTKE